MTIGIHRILVKKTKAHKAIDACRCLEEIAEAKQNHLVDAYAKAAALQHPDVGEAVASYNKLVLKPLQSRSTLPGSRFSLWITILQMNRSLAIVLSRPALMIRTDCSVSHTLGTGSTTTRWRSDGDALIVCSLLRSSLVSPLLVS